METFWQKEKVNFLPATGCTNIPSLANLLLGWGLEFSVVVDDDSHGRKVLKELKENQVLPESKLVKAQGCDGIEDIFTKKDFAKIVLNDEAVEIADDIKISKYIKNETLSKPIIARDFLIKVEKEEIRKIDLSKETQDAIDCLLKQIMQSLESNSRTKH